MLIAKNIQKAYNDLEVLKGVDLSIPEASITSIVGKSGTGKSTLLHILGSLDRPDNGKVEIDGIDIYKLNAKKLSKFRNEKIGFIFQFHHLIPEFTALENVAIPALINNTGKREAMKMANELLDYLGLSDRISHKPNELSGGEQQRVAVARALINKPKIIFADEPTGNLDTQTSIELHDLIVRLKNEFAHTFVIVTHNLDLAKMSDRSIEMKDGFILKQ
ncbi:MAG: ABC transporter ATP-binding protein [Saprospiraceae bacterium]|nr:ABC transporter ATP-binding protein [Bacteroidia bacterium]NNL91125.1 ABC transporter ATP-binding protein [Saprospiraceae bacterium]